MTYSAEVLADSPALYWKFDESLFVDSGSNGAAFTPGTGVVLSKTALTSDGGAAVAGSGSDAIAKLGSIPASLNGANVTVECWVKIPAGNVSGTFVKLGDNNTTGWAIGIGGTSLDNTGKQLILLNEAIAFHQTGYTFTTGTHHLMVVRGASGAFTCYVDGSSVATGTMSSPNTATAGIGVGGYATNRYLSSTVDIDNVAIFASALNSTRVTAHYASGSGSNSAITTDTPVVWLKLDEPNAAALTIARDASGNSHSGTHNGGVTVRQTSLLADASGFSASYDGTDDYTTTSYASYMNGGTLTVEARIKPDSGMLTGQQFIASRWGSAGQRTFLFSLNAGKVEVSVMNALAATVTTTGATTLSAGTTYTVAFRQDGTTLKVFLNGVSDGSSASTSALAQPLAGDIEMGRAAGSVYGHVNVDEFSYTLSAVSDARLLTRHNAAAGIAPVIDGTAALTQASTLTTTGSATPVASAALTQASTLTTTATAEAPGSVAGLTQSSALTASATVTYLASAALTQASTLAAAGVVGDAIEGTADLTSTSTLDAAGDVTATVFGTTVVRNRAAGTRHRTGTGTFKLTVPVDAEPTVVASPVSAITTPVWIAADTIPALTSDAAGLIVPVGGVEKTGEWGRFRVIVGGRDVTFFRGIPMPQPTYQLTDPYEWGPATINLPSVFFTEVDDFGEEGELRWLRKGAPVTIEQVVDGEVASVVWRGDVDARNVNAFGTIDLECSGALSGPLAKRWRPQDLTRGTADISFLLSVAIQGQLATSYDKAPGWYTDAHDGRIGIEVAAYEGGQTWLSYVDKLLGWAITPAGDSWTVLANDAGELDLIERDLDTVDATVYLGGRGVEPALVDDSAESPNRFYGEGVDDDGNRWRNAFYPQTTAALDSDGELVIPDYPFTDNRTFGLGTTNGDTDTGDGIFVLQNELIGSSVGFRLLDRANEYNQATVNAVAEAQRNAGLTATGSMNPATWTVLMGDAASTWSLGQAIIRPLVFDPATERFLYNQNGSVIGLNPLHDRSVEPVDRHINFGPGVSKQRGYLFCLREYNRAQRAQWRGTITLNSDVIAGDHGFGDTATAMSRLDLRPGMNIRVKHLGSSAGFVMHIASIDVAGSESGPSVTLQVDCQGRPAVDLAAILQRDKDSRGDFARRAFLEHTRGSIQSDAIIGGDVEAGFGVVRRTALRGGEWNEIQVIGGQSGTLEALKLYTSSSDAAFACAITARSVGEARFNRLVPTPLADPGGDDPTEVWTDSEIADLLFTQRWGLYASGTFALPCGYFPKRHTNLAGEVTGWPITGDHEDSAGQSFWTLSLRSPWLYLYVWPDRDCFIEGELKIQTSEGA